ncbi:iron complex transport system permease protein [Quadrisphaera granulorum]|uniref:Iron complex transport system permease protein n=1 Tax=Quadrisphaera granulorum TaxID=317664 RepID=A0A315ZX60_9ACTN|nr:iron chelate uptake ABC transporter family permease subunit [Quadrisphaera granulorum]PWJ50226.1 iron complex transport system permease protein [Quadrisphaera granulorum]SZE97992.1 iron complex transport system permease protein [Quadrisphaera granulorum]
MSAQSTERVLRDSVLPAGVSVLRGPLGTSVRVRRRSVAVVVLLLVLLVAMATVGMTTGDLAVPPVDVVRALLGTADPGTAFVVTELRAPRVVTALLVGAALGAAGAVFQGLTGNPLGSPDVIGFTSGAAAGGVVAVLHGSGQQWQVSGAAVAGGLLTAAAVYALSVRGGVLQPFRLVLVGLGTGYAVYALNAALISRANVLDALTAERWTVGSTSQATWSQLQLLAVGLVVLTPLLAALSRPLTAMEVGDDTSRALGVRLGRARLLLALVGVLLAALAVGVAGPIAFVALVAPQVTRRLTRAPGPGLLAAAFGGAALLLLSDLIASRFPDPLPVGLVTGAVGGLYLVYLLVSLGRRR